MNELAIILFLLAIMVILYTILISIDSSRHAKQGRKDEEKSTESFNVPKYASPLSYDDKVIYCKTLGDIAPVRSQIETLLKDIDHLWLPQEVLQAILLVKYYLGNNLYYVYEYNLIRYFEALILHLNIYNSDENYNDKNYPSDAPKEIIFDEINHIYFLALDIYHHQEVHETLDKITALSSSTEVSDRGIEEGLEKEKYEEVPDYSNLIHDLEEIHEPCHNTGEDSSSTIDNNPGLEDLVDNFFGKGDDSSKEGDTKPQDTNSLLLRILEESDNEKLPGFVKNN